MGTGGTPTRRPGAGAFDPRKGGATGPAERQRNVGGSAPSQPATPRPAERATAARGPTQSTTPPGASSSAAPRPRTAGTAAERDARRVYGLKRLNILRIAEGDLGAVWALTAASLRTLFRSKLMLLVLALSALNVAAQLGFVIFLSTFFPDAIDLVLNRGYFLTLISGQVLFFTIVVGFVGSVAAARDRMMGGLEFLLSKALPPWGYVVGRAAPPLVAALIMIVLPVVVASLSILLLVDGDLIPSGTGKLMWGAIGMALVFAFTLGPLAAGLGTLVDNPRKAVALWLVVVWLTVPLATMALTLNVDTWWMFSPTTTAQAVGGLLLDVPLPQSDKENLGWLLCVFYFVAPLVALYWRTREVVRS